MRLPIILLVLTLFVACAPIVKFAPFTETTYKSTTTIDMFSSAEAVKKSYTEIGLITADDNGWDRSEVELITQLRKKAMAIGADALILQGQTQKDAGSAPIGDIWYKVVKTTIRGVAIKYLLDTVIIDTLIEETLNNKQIENTN